MSSKTVFLINGFPPLFKQVNENNAFGRKGANLQVMADLLTIVFVPSSSKDNEPDYLQRIKKCFKVHIDYEEQKQYGTAGGRKGSSKCDDGWITTTKSVQPSIAKNPKVINYWCFYPGFAMISLMDKNVRSIILTSGTLAPLKPLISELGIPIKKFLENPHIINQSIAGICAHNFKWARQTTAQLLL
jgi:regulator of telomere elongation helicase 1